MRILSTLIFLVTITRTFGQYIDSPNNILNKPNGDILFTINSLVSFQSEGELQNDWNKVNFRCFVKPNQLIDKRKIKANSLLLNSEGDSIGYTLIEFQVDENFDNNYLKYNELKLIEIELSGFVFKNNMKNKFSYEEIRNTKTSYLDSCQTRYIAYQEKDGQHTTLVNRCNMYETLLLIDNEHVPLFVKELQYIKKSSNAEGQESIIKLEMKSDYFSENTKTKFFVVKADKIDIRGRLIKSVEYGCCGAEEHYQLFNLLTFNKLMDYESKLYTIDIPNSRILGYLGFCAAGYEPQKGKMIIGTLFFTNGDSIINKVNFVTQNKKKYDNIIRYYRDMRFVVLNTKDKIQQDQNGDKMVLWSKYSSESPNDLSGFQFAISFYDESNHMTYTQRLNFISGYINGNNKKEFDIMIDENKSVRLSRKH